MFYMLLQSCLKPIDHEECICNSSIQQIQAERSLLQWDNLEPPPIPSAPIFAELSQAVSTFSFQTPHCEESGKVNAYQAGKEGGQSVDAWRSQFAPELETFEDLEQLLAYELGAPSGPPLTRDQGLKQVHTNRNRSADGYVHRRLLDELAGVWRRTTEQECGGGGTRKKRRRTRARAQARMQQMNMSRWMRLSSPRTSTRKSMRTLSRRRSLCTGGRRKIPCHSSRE